MEINDESYKYVAISIEGEVLKDLLLLKKKGMTESDVLRMLMDNYWVVHGPDKED